MKTICQLCSRKCECHLVKMKTKHLHPKGRKLTGHMGSAELSVCHRCAKKGKL